MNPIVLHVSTSSRTRRHRLQYNYLNDDEHGVIGTAQATVFPMGVGMGASWSSETVHLVGTAIGVEARSTHNVLADKSGNSCGSTSTGKTTANGCGITLYAPNINLVRDPRELWIPHTTRLAPGFAPTNAKTPQEASDGDNF